MLKISALVATVVLGLSGVAAAAPGPAVHGPLAGRYERMPAQRWTLLDTAQSRGGRQVINVNSSQRFTKLKLEAGRGTAVIDKVLVTFGNGRTQVIEVDARIGANASKVIDLAGNQRAITKIVILSQGRTRASYSVLAA